MVAYFKNLIGLEKDLIKRLFVLTGNGLKQQHFYVLLQRKTIVYKIGEAI